MNSSRLLKLCILLLFISSNIAFLQAQTGTINGIITDEFGTYMPKAFISIPSQNKQTVSDFDGKFTLVNIPVGAHKLTIDYLGYKRYEIEITIDGNQTTFISIVLTPASEQLDDVTITIQNNRTSKALTTQKNNLNITNVIATDQIGKFPDANVGDALKRVPGITMQVDQGEARNIIVRGLSPQLNSVTLNGSRIPSAEGDNRNVQLDLIPSDMIQAIQVNKAVTPDMEADALGGSVNLITRTAPQGFRVSATAGSGINFITNKRILNGSFLIGNRSKNQKLGWMLSAAINDNDFGSDNIEAEWDNEFEYNTGEVGDEGEAILETLKTNPYTNEFQIRKYLVQRIRRSFAANLDYRFDNNNSIYFKSMYNWRDDRENRFRLEHKVLDGEDIEEGDFEFFSSNLNGIDGFILSFPAEVKRQTKGGIDNNRNKNTRLEDQRMQNYSFGGDHLIGNIKIDWMAAFAKASEERRNERYTTYESEYGVNVDNTNPEKPLLTAINLADTDFANFEFDEITEENQYTEEEDINFYTNVQIPIDIFQQGGGYIKLGVRSRLKQKIRDNNFFEFEAFEDIFPLLSDIPIQNYTDGNFLAGSQYQIGSFPNREWLGQLNLQNGEAVPDEFLRANFDVQEDIFAGYAMAEQKLTSKLTLLAGLRLEHTNITATGNEIENEENLVQKITDKQSYINILPGVHLKYDFSSKTVFRFAWTNTIARPNYEDLVPSLDVVFDDEEIYIGNPDLNPTTSMNFDLMAEHYFSPAGILSGGIFYKNLNDFIYTDVRETNDDSFGTDTTEFDVFQPLNGSDANILGIEVAWQQQLDFLPGFAKNLNLYLNFTYLTSNANGIRNDDGEERTNIDLPNTAPQMFNGSLGYDNSKFSLRISANYSDAYIDEIQGNDFEDRYYDKQFFLDANLSYAINKNLRIYADLNNITNQELRFYQGTSDRTAQAEFYDRRLNVGLKYDLLKKK